LRIAVFHNLTSGGAKRSLHELVRHINLQHELIVHTYASANHDFGDIRPYVRQHHIHPFSPGRLYPSPFGRLNPIVRLRDLNRLRTFNQTLADFIQRDKPDVIFVQPCQFENCPSILQHLEKIPTVYFCHEPIRVLYEEVPPRPYEHKISFLRKTLDRIDPFPQRYRNNLKESDFANIQKASMVLVNSVHTQKNVQNIYRLSAHVNYLGVDTNLFKPLKMERQPFVLSVGSLTPLKGFDFIIRALGRIPASQRLRFVISSNFSNPPEFKYLKQLALDCAVEIDFLNGVSDQKLVELYNTATLTVYAPYREPFGLVALESMACGTAVLGIREGGLLETIEDGVNGRLVERNEDEFSRVLSEMISEPKMLAEMGKAANRIAFERWGWKTAAHRLITNFELAIKGFTQV
jgi:glycosyltransferase involved in cell wall biosynthesis